MLFLHFTGILSSGFHLIDDKDVFIWIRDADSIGLWKSFLNRLALDMQVRFRYTYVVIRVLQSYFWGDDFNFWHYMYGMLTAVNMILAYYYARRRKCHMSVAFSFAVTIFVGCWQTQVIWRLGPQENLGIFFLLLVIINMRNYYENKTVYWNIAQIISIYLLAGAKESFLLLLPALPFLVLIWNVVDNKISDCESLKKWLKNNAMLILYVYVLFMVCIILLVSLIGGTSFGYAGVDSTFGIADWIKSILSIVFGDFKIYELVVALAIIWSIYVIIGVNGHNRKQIIITFVVMLIVLFTNIGMQYVLHAKSGLLARYTLPLSFIVVYFAFIGLSLLQEFGKRNMIVFVLYSAFMGFLLIVHVNDELGAREYAEDGATITALFSKVSEIYKDDDKILVDIDFEQDYSTAVYLLYEYGIRNVYNVNYSEREDDRYYNRYDSEFDYLDYGKADSITLDDATIIIREKNMSVETESIKDDDNYDMYEYGNYQLFVKNMLGHS